MLLAFQLALGCVMIGITVMMHAVGLDIIIRSARWLERVVQRLFPISWKPFLAGGIVVNVFGLHVLQIWFWAFLYLALRCAPLHGLEDALYFSTVIYSTLGLGDIVLERSCRMLSGIEAANGFILFGWTTAFIFEVISQLYRREGRSLDRSMVNTADKG